MGKKAYDSDIDESDTKAITRETVMETFSLEEMEQIMEEKRREALPRLFLRIKQLVHDEGVTFHQVVQHAIESGALEGFGEEGEAPRGYSKPIYINPDNADDVYKGSGPQPDWLKDRVAAGHHYYEFRSDHPLEGRTWRNAKDEKQVWKGRGVMPEWLQKEMFWPKGGRKPREYILRIAEDKG